MNSIDLLSTRPPPRKKENEKTQQQLSSSSSSPAIISSSDTSVPNSTSSLPPTYQKFWAKQIMEDDDDPKTKSDWENTLARKILSVFASTIAAKGNEEEGQSLLAFVGDHQVDPSMLNTNSNSNSVSNSTPSSSRPSKSQQNSIAAAAAASGAISSSLPHIIKPPSKSISGILGGGITVKLEDKQIKTKKSQNTKKKVVTLKDLLKEDDNLMKQSGNDEAIEEEDEEEDDEQEIKKFEEKEKKKPPPSDYEDDIDKLVLPKLSSTLAANIGLGKKAKKKSSSSTTPVSSAVTTSREKNLKSENSMKKSLKKSENLANNNDKTLKKNNPQTAYVAPPPPCYPIWFVGNDPAHKVDWSSLPGGSKLQAHLACLYEEKSYENYIQVIELVILRVLKEIVKGISVNKWEWEEEEVEIPEFGLSSRYPNANYFSNSRKLKTKKRKEESKIGGKEEKEENFLQNNSTFSSQNRDNELQSASLQSNDTFLDHTQVMNQDSNRSISKNHEKNEEIQQNLVNEPLPPSITVSYSLSKENLSQLWIQLIRVTLGVSCLSIEQGRFHTAMNCINKAQSFLAHETLIVDETDHRILFAEVRDCLAFYFYQRKRLTACLAYLEEALKVLESVLLKDGVGELRATLLVHMAAALIKKRNFKLSHRKVCDFFALLESGNFGATLASPRNLTLTAIAYHLQSVSLFNLNLPYLSLKASQYALRVSRLTLAWSLPWVGPMKSNHALALLEVRNQLASELGVLPPKNVNESRKVAVGTKLGKKPAYLLSKDDDDADLTTDYGVDDVPDDTNQKMTFSMARIVLRLAESIFSVEY